MRLFAAPLADEKDTDKALERPSPCIRLCELACRGTVASCFNSTSVDRLWNEC